MKQLSNNEAGNLWTAHILAGLLEAWPRREDFNWLDVARKTEVFTTPDEPELFDDLISWLSDEGYIRIGSSADEGSYYDVSLTEKSMTILRKKPNALEPSLGTQLKDVVANGGAEVGRSAISEIVTTIIATGSAIILRAASS